MTDDPKSRRTALVPFDPVAARAAWDEAADRWDHFVASGQDYHRVAFHGPALLDACGPVEGRAVLDLGCGQGYFSRLLAATGALITGIDHSARLIEHARRYELEAPLGVEYHILDAAAVADRWPDGSFDLIVGCVSFQDFAAVEAALAAAQRVLRAAGRLVFSIPHPFFDAPSREWARAADGTKAALQVDRYFDSGPRVIRWDMKRLPGAWETPYWSRTLAEWTNLLADAGFLIRRLHEPGPSLAAVAAHPGLAYCLRVPAYLIFDAVKPAGV